MSHAPLNLLQLASGLQIENYDVRIIDYHPDQPSNHELRELLGNALLAGISSFTGLQSAEAIRIAIQFKTINPDLPFVWGGYHPSLWPELAIKSDLVDFVVIGPGEDAIVDIANSIRDGKRLESKIIIRNLKNGIPAPATNLTSSLWKFSCPSRELCGRSIPKFPRRLFTYSLIDLNNNA